MLKKLLPTLAVVAMASGVGTAFAGTMTLVSTDYVPGYTQTEAGTYEKDIVVDDKLLETMDHWTLRFEERSTPAIGFHQSEDGGKWIKETIVRYDPLVDGPKYCSHIEWAQGYQPGFVQDDASGEWFKMHVLTVKQAQEQGFLKGRATP